MNKEKAWSRIDPREVLHAVRRREIIIFTGYESVLAYVSTKGATNPWSIHLPDRHFDVDSNWPPGWVWTIAPANSERVCSNEKV